MRLSELVLVVAEDAELMQSLTTALAVHDIEVVSVMHGEEAIELARARLPCLVLIELYLPGAMGGFEVARQLRANHRTSGMKLVVMSAWGEDPSVVAEGMIAGCDEVVGKPPRIERVVELARNALRACEERAH